MGKSRERYFPAPVAGQQNKSYDQGLSNLFAIPLRFLDRVRSSLFPTLHSILPGVFDLLSMLRLTANVSKRVIVRSAIFESFDMPLQKF